jgi:hypothetical protein
MAMSRPQSSRNSNHAQGSKAAQRNQPTHNKNNLKSDHTAALSANPAAQQDQFGSKHNHDKVAQQQRATGQPGGKSDLAFRESAQDTQPTRGAANKQPGRRRPNSGDQKHH